MKGKSRKERSFLKSISGKRIVVLLLLVLLGSLLAWTFFAYREAKTLRSVQEIPMIVEVGLRWGYIPFEYSDNTVLNFSRIITNQQVVRNITLSNPFDSPVRATINAKGKITQLLSVSENVFELGPKESKDVEVMVWGPDINLNDEEDMEEKRGFYEGVLVIKYYKT